jgi:hypothetical protein
MNRSGYSDDLDNWALIRWRGAVLSAIRGKRGQAILRELVRALDALPERKLAAGELLAPDGKYCALGAIGRMRGMDMRPINMSDYESLARAFGITVALAAEITYENDGCAAPSKFIEERRWEYMRDWAMSHIKENK